jgi:uncharacterized protein YjbI with pentapeptide repeats
METRLSRPLIEDFDYQDIKNTLDESSKVNRRILSSFIIFQLYILVTVGITTDAQLLIATKSTLPLINVELPLRWFYFIIPFIVIGFHFNVLLNLSRHSLKLYSWAQERKKRKKRKKGSFSIFLQPFLFNFLFPDKSQTTLDQKLLNALLYFILYLFPLILLFLIQYKLSKIHDFLLTSLHFGIIILDLFFLDVFWNNITNPSFESQYVKVSDYLKKSLQFFTDKFFLKASIHSKISLLVLLPSIVNYLFIISLFIDFVPSKSFFFYPRLVIKEEILFNKGPSDELISEFLERDQIQSTKLLDFVHGLNLRGRDLRFAELTDSIIFRADLKSAKLQSANMKGIRLQGAYLRNADLSHANLAFAQMDRVDLKDAVLNEANLSNAQIKFSYAKKASFRRAVLIKANFKGTNLEKADFRDAKLNYVNFDRSYLRKADFSSADMKYVTLRGAFAVEAKLSESDLSHSFIEGSFMTNTNFFDAQLENATISATNLQRSKFERANLSDAKFLYSDLSYSDFKSATLHGSSLIAVNINGSKFTGADLNRIRCVNVNVNEAKLFKENIGADNQFCGESNDKSYTEDLKQNYLCENKFFALGIIRQSVYEMRKQTIDYLQNNCEDIKKQIGELLNNFRIDEKNRINKSIYYGRLFSDQIEKETSFNYEDLNLKLTEILNEN